MSDKPTYLGLLNAIALGESRAHCYFEAWIASTCNPEVKAVLATVSAREGEHGMAFAKRINELGFGVQDREDPGFAERLAIAGSDLSDLEKMEKLGVGQPDDDLSIFDDVFKDHSIDVRTGELLGRYIAEEHDTTRLVRSCYEQLKAQAATEPGAKVSDQLTALTDQVDGLCRSVEELRQIVCGQAMPATGSRPHATRAPNGPARRG
jgi:hypothetical protein